MPRRARGGCDLSPTCLQRRWTAVPSAVMFGDFTREMTNLCSSHVQHFPSLDLSPHVQLNIAPPPTLGSRLTFCVPVSFFHAFSLISHQCVVFKKCVCVCGVCPSHASSCIIHEPTPTVAARSSHLGDRDVDGPGVGRPRTGGLWHRPLQAQQRPGKEGEV